MLFLLAQAVPFDWTVFGVSAIQALVPVVTSGVIWFGRSLVTSVPRAFIPILAVVLATGLDFVVAYASGGVFNPVVGALLGAATVWLRELVDTIDQHGLRA
jgi:hypothetical protein